MPDEHRLTIRLSQELYAQLVTCGWPGQPLSATPSRNTSPGSQDNRGARMRPP
jgi:hypothetical protein